MGNDDSALGSPFLFGFSQEISGWLRSVKSYEDVKNQGFSSWSLKATRNGVH
jgi:hypothetical protein